MCTVDELSEVLHFAISVRILKENAANVLTREIHLMRKFQLCLDTDVTAT